MVITDFCLILYPTTFETMDIACSTDRNYLKYCITMLLSLFDHHRGEEVCIHLLSNGLHAEDTEKVRRVTERFHAQLKVYDLDESLLSTFTQGQSYITSTTYARLFLPEILPAEITKVIYLDCDLLVLDTLTPLWDMPLESCHELAVVEDSCSANPSHYERLQLPDGHRYFNAGVLLINLFRWRERGFTRLALELLGTTPLPLLYADQDVLNILCTGRTYYLPFRYNLQEPMLRRHLPEMSDDARKDVVKELSSPVVVHFTYTLKPWLYTSFHPYRGHFYHYFDQTEWKGERPTPSWSERIRRLMWWAASKVRLVNTYHPLPKHMRIEG